MSRWFILLLPTLLLLTVALASGDEKRSTWHEVLPAQEFPPLVDELVTALKKPVEALVGGKLDDDDRERAVKKARGLALILAAGALTTESKGAGAARRGAVHHAAAQLDRLLLAGKFADAKRVLDALADGKETKAPFTALPLVDVPGRDDAVTALMIQFRIRAAGGLGVVPPQKNREHDGLEGLLRVVGNKGDAGLKPEQLARFAYRLAVLAEATRSLPPPRAVGEKDPAKRLRWSDDFRTASLEMAEAARSNNPMALRKAALKVGRSCNQCHRVFRDN